MYRAASYVWFSLLGATCGAFATAVIWFLLATLLWLPNWRVLRAYGMYVHDVEATYLVAFGWPVTGALFFVATLLSLLSMTFIKGRGGRVAVYFLNALPAVVVLLLLNPHLPSGVMGGSWHYPLAETAVLAIGLCWSFLLQKIAAGATDN
jgi:hypothetical protein